MHRHRLDRDRDLKKRPDADEGCKQPSERQIPYVPLSSLYICLAPVHHLGGRLSAVYTGIGQLLLLKGHTAGGHAHLLPLIYPRIPGSRTT